MPKVIITARVMPVSPDVNLDELQTKVLAVISEYAGSESDKRVSINPVAFGLKAIDIIFILDDKNGIPDEMETKVCAIEGANSFQITDVRRAIG
jgi:elongation factor 1-beta